MIRHMEGEDPCLWAVTGHPFLAANIGGRAACPQPDQDFWVVQGETGKPHGYLCRTGETLYVVASQGQAEEIAEFAPAVGFVRMMTNLTLPFEPDRPLLCMEQGGAVAAGNPRVQVQSYPALCPKFSVADFAALQYASHALATREEAQRYAVSLWQQIRSGGAVTFTVRRGGQMAAGASLSPIYRGTAVLGAVAVLPEYRRQGLGSAVVAAACGFALEQGWQPLLCCDPALEALYGSVGFLPAHPIHCYRCPTSI